MADVQLENGFIRIANSLYDEILKRDFSKYQLSILMFIIRYSWGCGKKSCSFIMSDFEQSGISKTHIKQELTRLEQAKVLLWNKELSLFQINKDFDEWVISYHKFYTKDKTEKLLKKELSYKNWNYMVTKIGTNGLQKLELPKGGETELARETAPPKDIVKTSKDITTTSQNAREEISEEENSEEEELRQPRDTRENVFLFEQEVNDLMVYAQSTELYTAALEAFSEARARGNPKYKDIEEQYHAENVKAFISYRIKHPEQFIDRVKEYKNGSTKNRESNSDSEEPGLYDVRRYIEPDISDEEFEREMSCMREDNRINTNTE